MAGKYVYIKLLDGTSVEYDEVSSVVWFDQWVKIFFPKGFARIAIAHVVGYEELDLPK